MPLSSQRNTPKSRQCRRRYLTAYSWQLCSSAKTSGFHEFPYSYSAQIIDKQQHPLATNCILPQRIAGQP